MPFRFSKFIIKEDYYFLTTFKSKESFMKPFKNILMLPHPFPTVLIGHMKLCLYLTFLSLLLLSGCGGSSGGGGGEGATSSSKKAKACTTPLSNGKGELPWNTKTKKYSTICKVAEAPDVFCFPYGNCIF